MVSSFLSWYPSLLLVAASASLAVGFSAPSSIASSRTAAAFPQTRVYAATSYGDSISIVDANVYNIDLDLAVSLWTASVSPTNTDMRQAGVPYLDSKDKNHFVDDLEDVVISRDGGLGMNLQELAGGRDDGFGITVVTAVTEGGNAERAGIIAGDSIASVSTVATVTDGGGNVEDTSRTAICECADFDNTIQALTEFPGGEEEQPTELVLGMKRLRRWPKVTVEVSYPPIQCADPTNNKETIELFAGENLQRALLNRGIIMEDPGSPKCDYCGNKCTVRVNRGVPLLNPLGMTEEKLMANNANCRLSCKTTVAPNMQEGEMQLQVNLRAWKEDN